jgi:hypothetical protein
MVVEVFVFLAPVGSFVFWKRSGRRSAQADNHFLFNFAERVELGAFNVVVCFLWAAAGCDPVEGLRAE